MTAADRAKAAEIVADWQLHFDADQTDVLERMIETNLAAARAAAVEQITTDVRALAEELDGETTALRYAHDATARWHGEQIADLAARLLAVVADTGTPDTSSEEEQA